MENKNVFPVSEMKKAILDCYELPMDTDMFETFPVLKSLPFWDYKFPAFKDKAEARNCFARYCIYYYSPNLTCIEELHPEISERKFVCAKLAGFKTKEDGSFEDKVDEILKGKNESTNQMIFSLLRRYGSFKWTTLKSLEDKFHQNLEKQQGVDGLEFQRITDALKKLEALKNDLLKGDTGKQINESLVQRIHSEDLKLSPEAIAENISQGKSPLGFTIEEGVELCMEETKKKKK